jgi:zinc transport system ATP-binding protein
MEASRPEPALIEVVDLLIGYQGRGILPPVNFAFRAGEVTSIVGHNGSGKSTLLKTLLGIQPRISGAIRFSPRARLGYVPQRESMDPIYPVRVHELVETGRYGARGVGRRLSAEDRAKVERAIDVTQLRPLAGRLFRTLSGGEQQRALLARALCAEPTVLILDEPTASMDEKSAAATMKLTLELARESRAAVVMVNHFIDLVNEISDQVVLLDQDHQVVRVGPPAEILVHRGRAF